MLCFVVCPFRLFANNFQSALRIETAVENRWRVTDFVEGLQVSDGRAGGEVVWEFILQVGDQHPKLSPPVSHMVQPEGGQSSVQTKVHN